MTKLSDGERASLRLCDLLKKTCKDFTEELMSKEDFSAIEARRVAISSLNAVTANVMIYLFPEIPNEDLLEKFCTGLRVHPRWNDEKSLKK